MTLDIEEIKLSEKLQKMYKEFLIYVEQENVEFERTESKKLELQLKEKIQWLKRYLIHLEKGGKRIQAGADYWAQHQNHKLIIENGEDEQGNIDQDILFLWCETCSDIVSSHIKKSDGNREFEKIENHLEHEISPVREIQNSKKICLTCNHCIENSLILCNEISEWFNEI
ncbi:MAG: hypothetical protein QGF73_02195 [Acidimicrobiales bacterium]|nr:hypothetical protein [Acidimicrobiales bacterium]